MVMWWPVYYIVVYCHGDDGGLSCCNYDVLQHKRIARVEKCGVVPLSL